jgi:membrane protein
MFRVLRQTLAEFSQDECPRLAAALAYYAIFSLPALLVLIVSIAGLAADREQAGGRLTTYFEETLGPRGAEQIETMLQQASRPGHGLVGWLVGAVTLVAGVTGVMSELQTALNRAWGVTPDPRQGGVRGFLIKRLLSLTMVLGIAFLLLVSLVVSWLLSEFSTLVRQWSPDWLASWVVHAIDVAASLAIITLLFAALLKYLPDVRLSWGDVWSGSILTSFLFLAGKYALSTYLAFSDVTSAFGAAGSLALVLLWIYYSALIFFLGAEFTQVLAASRGKQVAPEAGAKTADLSDQPPHRESSAAARKRTQPRS